MNFSSLLITISTLFLMLIVGFVAGKLGIVTPTASKNLSRLIIVIGQPALIIYSLVKMEYSAKDLGIGFQTLGFGLLLHIFLALLSFLCFAWYRDINERKISEFAAIFGNVGFIGFPILESTLGDRGVFMGAFFIVSFNLLLWTWGIAILARKRPDIKLTPKKILLNYGTVPSAIGIVIYLLKGLLPRFLSPEVIKVVGVTSAPFLSCLSYMASLCTPISMLIIGALLSRRSVKQILGAGKIYYHSAVKLILLPLIVCLSMKLLGFGAEWIRFAAIVSSMPSATTVTMLTELHDITPEYSAQVVGTNSLFSILTMPCVIWIAQRIIEL